MKIMNQKRLTLRPSIFMFIVAIVLISDQVTKSWAEKHLSLDGSGTPVIGHAFMLTLTHNTGGAWGLMPRGNLFFIGFALVASIGLVFAYQRANRELVPGAAFALALGGAIGNLLDRVRVGYVVDFFDIRIIHWPIFNVADSAISFSIVLLLFHLLRTSRTSEEISRSVPVADAKVSVHREEKSV